MKFTNFGKYNTGNRNSAFRFNAVQDHLANVHAAEGMPKRKIYRFLRVQAARVAQLSIFEQGRALAGVNPTLRQAILELV